MIYAKHPTLGNKHAQDTERDRMEAEGWVIWPRSAEQKAGSTEPVTTLPAESIKRGPGRPKKVAP